MKSRIVKYLIAVSLLLGMSSFSFFHEFYISITSVDYNSVTKKMEITAQYTAHDLEAAIMKVTKIDLNIGEKNQHPMADSLIFSYVNSHLQFSTDRKILLNLVGKEFNLDETLWVYLESESIEEPKKITIKNSVMTELFDAQSNITHVNFGDKQQTKSFNKINKEHTFLIP